MTDQASSPTLLKGVDLSRAFGGVPAVSHMSIELRAGEVHGLVGENGAGKSTLIAMLGGLLSPDEGYIECGTRRFDSLSPILARHLGINIVYQELSLAPNLTVAENISLGAPPTRWGFRIDRDALMQRAREVLNQLGVSIDPSLPIGQATLGDRQLTEIARAVAGDVQVLILDEPTSSLTHQDFERLSETVSKLTSAGVGILFVSHRLSEVLELAHRVTVMRDGKKVITLDCSATSERELASLMVGAELEAPERIRARARPFAPSGNMVLELRNASRVPSFEDVSMTVRSGEIVGLAGLRGSGRHELVDSIYGLDGFDSGELRVNGTEVRAKSPRNSRRLGVTYVPLNRKSEGMIGIWDVARNLALGNDERVFKWGLLQRRRLKSWVPAVLEDFSITPRRPEMPIKHLSGGNQQKVVLARNVVGQPRLLLLLEPTRGVDVATKGEIRSMIRDIAGTGAGILLVDSELSELVALCDRVYVMHRGRVAQELRGEAISEESVTYLAAGGE